MITFSKITRVPVKLYLCSGVIFIILINFTCASKSGSKSMHFPKSPDDENLVNSEGMWRRKKETKANTLQTSKLHQQKSTETLGASRFVDLSGMLTRIGLKKGASIFALVVFPILFPLMILLGVALFVISVFGTSGVAAAGRRSDLNLIGNSGLASGFSSASANMNRNERDDHQLPFGLSLTNRDGLAAGFDFDALEKKKENYTVNCMERVACELLLHGGSKILGRRATLEILRGLNVRPIITVPNSSPGRKSTNVWKCSALKCNWEKWIPWTEDGDVTRTAKTSAFHNR